MLEWTSEKPTGSIILAKLSESFSHTKSCYDVLYYSKMADCYYDEGGAEIPRSAIEKWVLIEK